MLITDLKLDNVREIVPLLTKATEAGKPLVLVARDFSQEVLSMLIANKLQGSLQVLPIKPAVVGSKVQDLLEDLALLSGTDVFSREKGQLLGKLTLSQLGSAVKALTNKSHTRIQYSSIKLKEEIAELVSQLRSRIEDADNSYDKEVLESRVKTLTGKFTAVYVGAESESVLKSKMQLANGAVKAIRAVLHGGVVPGGGIAYIEASWMVIRQKYDSNAAQIGANILYSALEAPFIALAENSGLEPLPLIVTLHESELGTGYNLHTGEITNMWKEYILDPTEVTKLALENAVSVVSELIGTSVAIYDAVSDDTSHF